MNTNLNMQTMPIERLKPAKYNPRKDLKPGDPAYEKIKRSLHDFGYVVSPAQISFFSGKCKIPLFQAALNHHLEQAEKRAQKKPEPLAQVHVDHNGMDHHFAGFLQLGNDAIQRIPAFSNAELPFDFSTFSGFQPFQLLVFLGLCRICKWLPELGTIQMNSVSLAVLQVLPGSEDHICQDSGRVVPVGFPVGFHRLLEGGTFVESIPP